MSLQVLRDSKPYHVAAAIVRKLQQHGYVAYFAGGSVRDALLSIPPKDIDIATSANPAQVQDLFQRTVPVGIQFGVVRVLIDEMDFEVATFRSEGVYLDGRRPADVRFSPPKEDAMGRDFTINGLFYAPGGATLLVYVAGGGA